jgi:5-dehydro-2-deoxygluconokinase
VRSDRGAGNLNAVRPRLDLIAIGRVSVDLYGQQIGSRLEDVATFAKAVGGCPANVAIGAARLGLASALISRVGDEPMGRFVLEQLAREGVETRGVRVDPQRLSSLVLLGVRDAQSFPLIFYRENCADSALCEDDIEEQFVASARAILVTGTHFSLPTAARAQRKAMAAAKAHGRTAILDIDYRPNLWGIGGHGAGESRYARAARVTQAFAPLLPECDLIVGTEEELHIAAGIEDTLAAARRIRSLTDAVIVCKRGARGCLVFAGQIPAALEDGLVAPALDIETYNVLGAGDAFLAGFLKGYLRGAPLEVSARLANACGALAVSRLLCSPEFPTLAELDYFLAHGSGYRALRQDPRLNHLHSVTTRRPQPQTLRVLGELIGSEDAARQRFGRFRRLAVDAVARVAAGQEGFGVSLEATTADPALRQAAGHALWVATALPQRLSRPLEFAGTGSLAVQLTEWPIDVTVHCRYQQRPDDPPEWRDAGERNLQRVAAICRAQGRELLLEVVAEEPRAHDEDTLVQVLSRIYALDVRPDWWQLEPQPDIHSWERCARVIAGNDGYCRGILVGIAAAEHAAAALTLAAATPIVRGFVAGGSIFTAATAAWRAGRLSDEAALEQVAERFRVLVEAWSAARGPGLDQLQRSAN